MLTDAHIFDVIEHLPRKWDESDIDGALDRYTDDVEYIEAGAGILTHGREALRAYLEKYFAAWESRCITKGMDLLMVRGDQVHVDEVSFVDRTQLNSFLAANKPKIKHSLASNLEGTNNE